MSLPMVTLNAEQTPTTTTLIIAEGTHAQHASVLKLVRKNLKELEEFGRGGFQIRPFETAGGPQQREVAILNEQQSTLVLSFMRNLPVVKEFKIALVKAFFEMAKKLKAQRPPQPALPDFTNPACAARAWAEQYEQSLALEAQVKSDTPKVEFAEAVTASDAEHTITEAAKVLSIRPRKFFDWLRMGGFIYKQGTQTMQISINKGLMVTRFHTFKHTDGELDKKAHARITGKGLYFFYQRLRHEGLIERNPNLELTA